MFHATIRLIKRLIATAKDELLGPENINKHQFDRQEQVLHQRTCSLVAILTRIKNPYNGEPLSRQDALQLSLEKILSDPYFDIDSDRYLAQRYTLKAMALESEGKLDLVPQMEPVPIYDDCVGYSFTYGMI